MGGHLCGVLLPENGRRSFVNHCLEPRSKRRDRAELQANVRHFELSRKRIAARMRTCQCMSHFVYNLRSRPLVRDLAARVRSQIASDHCRSDLITGLTHWARAGYPFPEVNLPEFFFFSLLREGISYPRSISLFRERLIFSKFVCLGKLLEDQPEALRIDMHVDASIVNELSLWLIQ